MTGLSHFTDCIFMTVKLLGLILNVTFLRTENFSPTVPVFLFKFEINTPIYLISIEYISSGALDSSLPLIRHYLFITSHSLLRGSKKCETQPP